MLIMKLYLYLHYDTRMITINMVIIQDTDYIIDGCGEKNLLLYSLNERRNEGFPNLYFDLNIWFMDHYCYWVESHSKSQ